MITATLDGRQVTVPEGTLVIEAARLNGIDVTDAGFEIKANEDLAGLEVELTSKVTTISGLVTKGLLPGVIFATDNCDATFEQLRAAGAEVMQEPIDQHYGVRDCAFRDPAGNMLRFSQSKPS